jgi:hypothetical protein
MVKSKSNSDSCRTTAMRLATELIEIIESNACIWLGVEIDAAREALLTEWTRSSPSHLENIGSAKNLSEHPFLVMSDTAWRAYDALQKRPSNFTEGFTWLSIAWGKAGAAKLGFKTNRDSGAMLWLAAASVDQGIAIAQYMYGLRAAEVARGKAAGKREAWSQKRANIERELPSLIEKANILNWQLKSSMKIAKAVIEKTGIKIDYKVRAQMIAKLKRRAKGDLHSKQ